MRKGEGLFTALFRLVARGRRRYGGYIVHVGIVLMYIGFTGAAYDEEQEAALVPGNKMEVGDYALRYEEPRMMSDPNKRMVYTDLTLLDKEGDEEGLVSPAKFIYRTHPQMPTTEVAIRSRPKEDVYVIMSTVDPATKRGTFRVIVRPLVAWIWVGGLILLMGSIIAMWPSARELAERRAPRRLRPSLVAVLAALALGTALAWGGIASAQSNSSSSLHAGTVIMHDSVERQLFSRLLCQCGDCQRLPLDTCACSWAEDARAEAREKLAAGVTPEQIQQDYRAKYGSKALAIPSDQGLDRALWAVPVAAMIAAIGFIFILGRRWQRAGAYSETGSSASVSDYDELLDDELARLEE